MQLYPKAPPSDPLRTGTLASVSDASWQEEPVKMPNRSNSLPYEQVEQPPVTSAEGQGSHALTQEEVDDLLASLAPPEAQFDMQPATAPDEPFDPDAQYHEDLLNGAEFALDDTLPGSESAFPDMYDRILMSLIDRVTLD